jgi:hypothetical protein
MRTALLIITDGRDDYLRQCIDSAARSLRTGACHDIERWMYDDTGDASYRHELRERYPEFNHIGIGPRRGCAGAIQQAWRTLWHRSSARFLFHLEQDFVFESRIDLDRMGRFLDDHPEVAQVTLRRNAVNSNEIAAGGVIEQHPDWYLDRTEPDGQQWLEHAMYWTCNPCLYRTELLDAGWPASVPGRYSEDTFHHEHLPRHLGYRPTYAYWGSRAESPKVRHIGQDRHQEGTGY